MIVTATLVLLGASFALFLFRMLLGPSLADRSLALDGLVVTAISALVVWSASRDTGVFLPVAVVLTLVGFIGTSVIARYIEDQDG